MEAELFITFPDQSSSFTYGVEYGRLLAKMERGDETVDNNRFPVRIENIPLIKRTCQKMGYTAVFGAEYFGEWADFLAIKQRISEN